MQAIFDPDDGSDDVTLCDYGVEEHSGIDASFDDVVEQILAWQAADAGMLNRAGRLVALSFRSARELASPAHAEAFVLALLRDFPRTTGTVTCECSNNGGSTVLDTITLTSASVRLAGVEQIGKTVILTWQCRGALVVPAT